MEHHYRRAEPRTERRTASQSPFARFGTVFLGAFFTLFGAGLGWLPVAAWERGGTTFVAIALVGSLSAFIGLFGFSMALQAALGRPTAHGFFMRWLMRAAGRTNPFLVFLTLAAVGATGLMIGLLLERPLEFEHGVIWLLGLAAFHLQVFFHEYGHWLAARGCGYRPFRVVGGAFGFSRKGHGRWVAHPNRDWRLLTGGAVFYSPAANVRTWSRDLWVVSAGPLATWLLVEICRELAPMVAAHERAAQFIDINIGLGWLALVVNLLPIRAGLLAFDTDGYRILELLRNRE